MSETQYDCPVARQAAIEILLLQLVRNKTDQLLRSEDGQGRYAKRSVRLRTLRNYFFRQGQWSKVLFERSEFNL